MRRPRPASKRSNSGGRGPISRCQPTDEIDGFVEAVQSAGVSLIGLNFFAGDLAGPDCGVLSVPSRTAEFRDNLDVAVGIGERLGVRAFNALYGNRVDGILTRPSRTSSGSSNWRRRRKRQTGSAPACWSSR